LGRGFSESGFHRRLLRSAPAGPSAAGFLRENRRIAMTAVRLRITVPAKHDQSGADLMRAVAGILDREEAAPADDDTIRKRVLAELARSEGWWAPRSAVTVTVSDGVGVLSGAIFEEKASSRSPAPTLNRRRLRRAPSDPAVARADAV
jgi:hypothetical protein